MIRLKVVGGTASVTEALSADSDLVERRSTVHAGGSYGSSAITVADAEAISPNGNLAANGTSTHGGRVTTGSGNVMHNEVITAKCNMDMPIARLVDEENSKFTMLVRTLAGTWAETSE